MNDIVERLRNSCSCNFPDTPCGAEDACRAAFDAADEIERLREWNAEIALNAREFVAENEKMRAALEWIAETTLTQPGLMVEKARAALEGRT